MRTVTFSDAKIAKLVNDNFVSTWVTRNPKFHNCDLQQERRIVSRSFECYATKNFCTFFVTPDLDVLHYFSGYYNPDFFRHEVTFVQELAKKALDDRGSLRKDGLAAFRALHERHATEHKREVKTASGAKPPRSGEVGYDDYRKNTEQWQSRKTYLVEGLQYLDRVHGALLRFTVKKGRPYALEEVIKNYMGGNEFTEE